MPDANGIYGSLRSTRAALEADRRHLANAPLTNKERKELEARIEQGEAALKELNAQIRAHQASLKS